VIQEPDEETKLALVQDTDSSFVTIDHLRGRRLGRSEACDPVLAKRHLTCDSDHSRSGPGHIIVSENERFCVPEQSVGVPGDCAAVEMIGNSRGEHRGGEFQIVTPTVIVAPMSTTGSIPGHTASELPMAAISP
jgi:hypothetical protein